MDENNRNPATISYILWGGFWEIVNARQIQDQRYEWYSSSLKNFRNDFEHPPAWMEELPPGKIFHWFGAGKTVYRPAGWQHELVFPEGRTTWVLTKILQQKSRIPQRTDPKREI